MNQVNALFETITLAFELVTDQLISPGALTPAVQQALDGFQNAIDGVDRATTDLRATQHTDEQEHALEVLSGAWDTVVRVMFCQGFELGRLQGLGQAIFTQENLQNL